MTPTIIFGVALLACVLARSPGKGKPAWSLRLKPWQMFISLVAVSLILLIVINPEFYALGILGDSAFFDLLVLAISFQLRAVGSQAWCWVAAGLTKTGRGLFVRYYLMFWGLVALGSTFVSGIQKAAHRLFS